MVHTSSNKNYLQLGSQNTHEIKYATQSVLWSVFIYLFGWENLEREGVHAQPCDGCVARMVAPSGRRQAPSSFAWVGIFFPFFSVYSFDWSEFNRFIMVFSRIHQEWRIEIIDRRCQDGELLQRYNNQPTPAALAWDRMLTTRYRPPYLSWLRAILPPATVPQPSSFVPPLRSVAEPHSRKVKLR